LQKYFKSGRIAGIQADHRNKLKFQLVAIDTATSIDDIDLSGFNLHPLKGKRKGIMVDVK